MTLREFKTRDELQALLDEQIEGDRREHASNNFLENTLQIAIAGEFTATNLEVFGFPETACQYIFFIEHSDVQHPFIQVRKPLTGHNFALLDQAVAQLVERKKDLFSKYKQLIIVGDIETGDAFDRHLSAAIGKEVDSVPTDENGIFYMTAQQREQLLGKQLVAPAGFTFGQIDVDTDGETIHRLWKNGLSVESTKNRLRYLPSICARTMEGKLVGWAMSARFGQVSNVFVMPEYRNRGIGQALELSVAQEFARRGMRVFKYVATDNTPVFEGSLRSPLWTLWMTDEVDDSGERKPELKYWRFCSLNIVK